MLKRLLLEDFMAHKRTELVFGPGLTVLTGPNNIGKSAVVEALRCAATNPPPKCCIRHTASQARVEAELEDGTRLVWIRKPSSARYEIYKPGASDPDIYAKFGNKVPEDVQALLRLPLVALDESVDPVDLHLGNQRKPIFLLDQPGSVKAAFFAASTEAAHLLSMQNLLKTKVQAAKREQRDCEARITELKRGLDRLAPLPGLELRIEGAAALLELLRRVRAQLPRLGELVRKLNGLRSGRARLAAGRAALAPLQASASLAPLDALKHWLRTFAQRSAEARREALRDKTLQPLQAPPALFDARGLAGLARRIAEVKRARVRMAGRARVYAALLLAGALFPTAELSRRCERLRALAVALIRARAQVKACLGLASPPELFSVARLDALRVGLTTARTATRQAETRSRQLGAVAAPPALGDPAPLAKLCVALREVADRRATASAELAAKTQALEAMEAAVAERLEAIGACPLCGGQLDARSFLHTGCGRAHE
jgi:exonuclease SbcC